MACLGTHAGGSGSGSARRGVEVRSCGRTCPASLLEPIMGGRWGKGSFTRTESVVRYGSPEPPLLLVFFSNITQDGSA